MNIGNQITYALTDPKRQNIQWVQVKNRDTGKTTVYQSKDLTVTRAQIESATKHAMDCIDCHNRPTHIYVPPDRSVNQALAARRLDANMPFIKQQAVAALTAEYKTSDEAEQGIAKSLNDFYAGKNVDKGTLANAVKEVQRIYRLQHIPLHAGGLADASGQHRALLLSGMLPVSRREPRERGRQGNQRTARSATRLSGSLRVERCCPIT